MALQPRRLPQEMHQQPRLGLQDVHLLALAIELS
jgi:hypothetical protein